MVCGYSEQPEAREQLPGDLQRVSELLENLGNVLASDFDVLPRHGTALQNLDIATQVIAAIRQVITGQNDWDTDAVELAGLCRSADQALAQQAYGRRF